MHPTYYLLGFLLPCTMAQYGGGGGSTTSTTGSSLTAATSSVPSQSGVHTVQVGPGGKFAYVPDTITASVGDTVSYIFNPLNHSVVQSTFDQPCTPSPGNPIFSGFMPVANGKGDMVFTIKINDTKPIWIYCAQTILSHCQSGMAMVINPPASGPNTLAAYKQAASRTGVSSAPASIGGGVFSANNIPSSSSSSSGSSPSRTSSGNGAQAARAPELVLLAIAGPAILAFALLW